MSEFIHLHVHSDFSLLDSAASIPGLIKKAQGLSMSHLAITDHGSMFGVMDFYRKCRKEGVIPIVGCELYMAPESRTVKTGSKHGSKNYHILLLAKNETGYKNLIRLSSKGYYEGFYYKPRIDKELLEEHHEGLICLTSCLQGEIPSLLLGNRKEEAEKKALYYRDLFGADNFYLEIQDHGIAEEKIASRGLAELAERTGIPLVATNDVHYVDAEDANAQDLLLCIGTNKKKADKDRMKFASEEFYLKSSEEMRKLFNEYPEALQNTRKIAEACNLEISLPGPMLPNYFIPATFSTPENYLRDLCRKGLEKRYGELDDELKNRADYELDIITSMGFTGYFLIVWDFIRYAKDNGVPVGPGRGSGAGSIVAYALEITDVDPIKYGLLFERFLNPERVSMPDFDIDFCFEGRQSVIDYVTRKYGSEKVGQIITFGTLKAKAVIRDVARVLDFPYAEADQIAKLIPTGPKVDLGKALELEPRLKEVAEKDNLHRELIETSKKLEGLHRHASTHPAGVVIGKEELTNYVPLYLDPKTKSISTQYTMDQLEDCGLVKMDFLGLKTLTLIKNTEKLLRKKGVDIDLDALPENDPATYTLLGQGKSKCVFQFESSGMQGILKRAKPSKIEDLIALNALYRPGPMDNIDQFIDGKWGRKPIQYPLSVLKPILEETYGVIVYQEQVMQITRTVAGFTLGQADILRRVMGKKKKEEMPKQRKRFIDGAVEKGYSKEQAESLFELLIPFAGYGFNKSHATAYSVLAYKTAYLKANFPAEFMAANLTNEISNPDKLAEYMEECRTMKISLLPPDINLSEKYYSVSDDKIVYGLVGIKNVGTAAVDEIIRMRDEEGPYESFMDFLERIDLKTVNKKVIEMGIQAGLFDSLYSNRASLFHNLEKLLEFAAAKKAGKKYGQVSLFEASDAEEAYEYQMEEVDEWPAAERLRYEKEALGFYFSGHPMDKYRDIWEKKVVVHLAFPDRIRKDKKFNFIGMLKSIREIQTKKGDRMAFAVLEDYNGSIEVILFPEVFLKYASFIENERIIGLIGKVERRKGTAQVIVEEIREPEQLEDSEVPEIHIRLADDIDNEEDLYSLRAFLFERNGESPVYIHLQTKEEKEEAIILASSQITISADGSVLNDLKAYPRVLEVWKQ